MTTQTKDDKELYSRQFENKNRLVGRTIKEVVFYLDKTDKDFTQQPNRFGKSLLNGIDIKTDKETFSIGNRYTHLTYGLSIDIGQTKELEFIEDERSEVAIDSLIIGQTIKHVDIYWMNIPIQGATGIYPQEIVIKTDTEFLLVSSIEINNGEVNTEFTDELLIVDNLEIAEQLKLGQFGLSDNGRYFYSKLDELIKSGEKNGL